MIVSPVSNAPRPAPPRPVQHARAVEVPADPGHGQPRHRLDLVVEQLDARRTPRDPLLVRPRQEHRCVERRGELEVRGVEVRVRQADRAQAAELVDRAPGRPVEQRDAVPEHVARRRPHQQGPLTDPELRRDPDPGEAGLLGRGSQCGGRSPARPCASSAAPGRARPPVRPRRSGTTTAVPRCRGTARRTARRSRRARRHPPVPLRGRGTARVRFLSYMRRSASRSSRAVSVWSVGQHPTAAESVIVAPSTTNGSAAAVRRRSAMESAWWGSVSSHRTANSSPPSRAATSPARSSATIRGCELGEHDVAHGVPEPVVHLLEPVEVEVEQVPGPDRAAPPAQHLAHPLREQGAVGQAGQRIVQRTVAELRLQALAVADVLDVHDQVCGVACGAGHPRRAHRHPDDPLVGQHEPALVTQGSACRRPA